MLIYVAWNVDKDMDRPETWIWDTVTLKKMTYVVGGMTILFETTF